METGDTYTTKTQRPPECPSFDTWSPLPLPSPLSGHLPVGSTGSVGSGLDRTKLRVQRTRSVTSSSRHTQRSRVEQLTLELLRPEIRTSVETSVGDRGTHSGSGPVEDLCVEGRFGWVDRHQGHTHKHAHTHTSVRVSTGAYPHAKRQVSTGTEPGTEGVRGGVLTGPGQRYGRRKDERDI